MRAIIHWRLLPEPLFTILFRVPCQILSSVFRVSRPCVVLLQRQRPREVLEKSDSALLFSHSEDSAAERFCCGRSFLKAPGGGERGHGTRSVSSLYFPREEFSKGHSAHSHTNLHWSALSTLVYAPGVLPRNSAINQPRTESNIKKNLKAPFSYERSGNNSCGRSFFLTSPFVLFGFPSPSLVCIWCRSKHGTFHKESGCESQRSLESTDKINK